MLVRLTFATMALLAGSLMLPDMAQAQSRAARLQEHERKIQEIIRERRARAAEEEAKRRAEEAERGEAEPEVEPAEDTPRRVSNVVMGLKFINDEGQSDYNIIIREGTQFVSEVYLFNVDQNPIDRVRLALDFDKRFIEPVRVFDTALRPYVAEEPEFSIDERDAIILYDATLDKPLSSPEAVLLRIMWRAVRPTAYTGIEFAFSPLEREEDAHTAIYARGNNILGVAEDPADGVISGGLMIEVPDAGEQMLQGKAEELREIYLGSAAADSMTGLYLLPPENEEISVGDKFVVRVALNNPEGALIDSINFAVKYDPKVLRVVDEDRYNYIIRGINVHDGNYHRNFPWDIHRRNEARNDRGVVAYQKSLSGGSSLPSRPFADIHFMAIAPATETEISFIKRRPGEENLTSVRYFGFEKLDLGPEMSQTSFSLPILNPPVEIAAVEDPEIVDAAVDTEEDLKPRALLIER